MNKDSLVQLTNNLYRLTLFFPKKEPLRYRMRELAVNILAKPNENDLNVLSSFFDVALVQKWASPSEILAIKKEYDNLRELLGKNNVEKQKNSEAKERSNYIVSAAKENYSNKAVLKIEEKPAVLNNYSEGVPVPLHQYPERQKKIMDFLRENGKAQVWQIKRIMPETSKRTLRRDFEQMLEQKIIERIGERNDTFYQIKTG